MYGPDYLVEEGVVLVTINYRLGPLGFLSLGNDTIFGNQVVSLTFPAPSHLLLRVCGT